MKLNFNSFFVRRFLACSEFDYPKTACGLFWRTVLFTIVWTGFLCAAVYSLVAFATTIWNIANILLGNISWAEMMQSEFARMAVVITGIITAGGVAIGYVSGTIRMPKLRSGNKSKEDGVATQMIKSLWIRLKEKTCAIIEYDDHPVDTRRKLLKELEDEHRRLLALTAKSEIKTRVK